MVPQNSMKVYYMVKADFSEIRKKSKAAHKP